MNPLKTYLKRISLTSSNGYWFVIGLLGVVLNLAVIPIDAVFIRPEYFQYALGLRITNSVFLAGIIFFIYRAPARFVRFQDPIVLCAVLLVATSISLMETWSPRQTYYHGIFQIFIVLTFGVLRAWSAVLAFASPVIRYWLITGEDIFQNVNIELYLFTFAGLTANRFTTFTVRERLKRASKNSLYRWTNGIVHEMKTPFATIQLLSQILLREVTQGRIQPGVLQERLEQIQKIAGNAMALQEHLLSNARTGVSYKKKFPVLNAHISLQNAVEGFFYKKVEQRKLILIITKNDFEFYGSESLFRNIIHNLIRNSLREIDYNEGGTIQISIDRDRKYNLIRFRDTAGGIKTSELKKIFLAGVSNDPRGLGAGYGLTFCKDAMAKMNGDIKVISDGSTYTEFTLHFPLREPQTIL